jgi:hypothetical protein
MHNFPGFKFKNLNMDKYLINNLVSPTSRYPEDDDSFASFNLSRTDQGPNDNQMGSPLHSGKLNRLI